VLNTFGASNRVAAMPALGTLCAGIKTMKTRLTAMSLCLGAGVVCLSSWDCDRAQAIAAQAPIQQTAATNQPPVRLAPTAGLKKLESRAKKGDAASQYELGVRYATADGLPLAKQEAVVWYRRASEQGNAKAQNKLGICYVTGTGVAGDWVEAVKWFRKAAAGGDADAECNLGECYSLGHGVQQDYAEAIKWFQKAAEHGSEFARTELARTASARRRAIDENWFQSGGGRSRIIQGPHEVPMPDPITDQTAQIAAVERPSQEAEKIKTLSDIVSAYNRNHTYLKGGGFVCGDMACDVWNMVKTKGIEAKIQVGNVERDITSLREADHAWVMAEISPGNWLALETTAGRIVQKQENPRYYFGWSFDNPKKFKELVYGPAYRP
jgi:TPR repeat protein